MPQARHEILRRLPLTRSVESSTRYRNAGSAIRLNSRTLPDCKLLVAHWAPVTLSIGNADHVRSAGWALPEMLAHAHQRTVEWRENAEYDERHAEEQAPPRQAQHHT